MSLISLVAIGPWQILIIVVVILFLFGGKRISEFMGGFGKGIKEFKEIKGTIRERSEIREWNGRIQRN